MVATPWQQEVGLVEASASIRVRKRADGSNAFDVRYRLDGGSKTTSFGTIREAERWASIVRRIGSAEAVALLRERDSAGGPTVDDWAERYIRGLSGIEGKTLDHYRLYMRVSISPSLGALPIESVSRQRIAEWINGQATRYASKTIKNRHGFLSAMFQAAVEDGLIDKNPCARSRLPESEQREMVFLSPEEYRTLLHHIPERWKLMVQLIAATGMRFGEVTALRPTDFDWAMQTVRVSRAWKSSTERGWYIGPPKTRRSRRTISLPSSLIPELRTAARAGNEFMFTNNAGDPVRQQRFWDDVWAPARRLANGLPAFASKPRTGGAWDQAPAAEPIGKYPRVHDLRHSHASWLIADDISLAVIQRRLGHESIQTTVDRYGHLFPDQILQPAATIDRLLRSSALEPLLHPQLSN